MHACMGTEELYGRHDYTRSVHWTLDMLQACDTCADMGMTYSVIVQCTDCVVFPYGHQQTACFNSLVLNPPPTGSTDLCIKYHAAM